jgi:hypothetical protein
MRNNPQLVNSKLVKDTGSNLTITDRSMPNQATQGKNGEIEEARHAGTISGLLKTDAF